MHCWLNELEFPKLSSSVPLWKRSLAGDDPPTGIPDSAARACHGRLTSRCDGGMSMNFTQAIARQEGFGVLGGRSTRNNNPVDIKWSAFARAHGATSLEVTHAGERARFACFPDSTTGFTAMSGLLKLHYTGLTVQEKV